MKTLPGDGYLRKALGGSTGMVWQVYARVVTDISESLFGGSTWTEVSSRIAEIPPITSKLEYEVGQFSTDAVTLELDSTDWWKDNILTDANLADQTKYIEFSIWAGIVEESDRTVVFSGFVDKTSVVFDEEANSVSVTLLTSQDIGYRLNAENLTTKYTVEKVDGTNNMLRLLRIPGLYVQDAAVSSYNLKVGTHTIYYQYDGGTHQAKLDDGEWTTLANGVNYLLNQAGDQKLKTYVVSTAYLGTYQLDRYQDDIVVQTAGEVLPWQWYQNVGLKNLIKKYYSKIGINTVTFDTLEMPTKDGSMKVSFIDNPPEDVTVIGQKTAIAVDAAGDAWVSVGNKVYKRTYSTDTYTLKATLSSGDQVRRMWYHKRIGNHEDLWLYIENGNTIKVNVYEIDNNILRTAQTLTTVGSTGAGGVHWNSCEVVDIQYNPPTYFYGFVYTVAANADNGFFKKAVKGSGTSITITTIFSDPTTPEGTNGYGFQSLHLYVVADEVRAFSNHSGGAIPTGYEGMTIDSAGTWLQSEVMYTVAANLDGFTERAVYHADDDRVYYYDSAAHAIKSFPSELWGDSTNHSLDVDPVEDPGSLIYANGKVYYTTVKNRGSLYYFEDCYLWSVDGNPGSPTEESNGPYTPNGYAMMAWDSIHSCLRGVSDNGLLWKHDTALALYVRDAAFPNQTITDSMNEIFRAFNIIGTVAAEKVARVYRRGDGTGIPLDSGNDLTAGPKHVANIREDKFKFPAMDIIRVSGYSKSNSYDGTTYGVTALSDRGALEITSKVIPDELVDHMCYWLYQFFKTAGTMVTVDFGLPYFHYEPFDNVVFSTDSRVAESISGGPIYSVTYLQHGEMVVEFLGGF